MLVINIVNFYVAVVVVPSSRSGGCETHLLGGNDLDVVRVDEILWNPIKQSGLPHL